LTQADMHNGHKERFSSLKVKFDRTEATALWIDSIQGISHSW